MMFSLATVRDSLATAYSQNIIDDIEFALLYDALYVSNDLEFSRRSDLDISGDGIESCWIELARTAQKMSL